MSRSNSFKQKVLKIIDPGKKNRGVFNVRRSGAVEINTDKILRSASGSRQMKAIEKMADEYEHA